MQHTQKTINRSRDLTEHSEKLREVILHVVRSIPKGETRSYGEVAREAGYPRHARFVGTVLKANYDSSIPCHRVILSSGKLGKYNRGETEKARILKREGYILHE